MLLYADSQFASPYALSVFVSLKVKGIDFELRTLATLQPKPFTVGLGFTHGYLDDFEPEEFDLPLDGILNDNGLVWPV